MIKRGHIYFVNLNPSHDREQTGYRPVLVISNDAINSQPLMVTVVVGTDAHNVQRDYPTNVRVTADETGLPLDTVFLCFQIRSLDHSRFMDPVTQQPDLAGKMPDHCMVDVENALQMTLMI
ncbi:MAG: type II toxin-antitoxin system PemK/MazF family toxin [Proteobacteria bacterium]|nr:type II toxin-antitoxin system PemK/MazF family toxin [Pseudomonadota bacterium]MBU1713961.1 type II toxin-antitoxin system PemK/MazF family toxin [Pseudomonadota bacterium]